jgi:sucrose phosphorylase
MISPDIFTVLRTSPEGDQHILAMTNVTPRPCKIEMPLSEIGIEANQWYDLVGKRSCMAQDKKLRVALQPYDVVWLVPSAE